MKKRIFTILISIALLTTNVNASECQDCSPEMDVIGTMGGLSGGAYLAYGTCMAGAVVAGAISAGAGFIAGMELCGWALAEGAVIGGSIGTMGGMAIDDARDCCD